jgi:hypothetical protein
MCHSPQFQVKPQNFRELIFCMEILRLISLWLIFKPAEMCQTFPHTKQGAELIYKAAKFFFIIIHSSIN